MGFRDPVAPGWSLVKTAPGWLRDLEPLTTGLLGQDDAHLWVWQGRVALGFRAQSVVYPVILTDEDGWQEGARALLARLAASWCLMGPTAWVEACVPFLPPSQMGYRVDYAFLTRPPWDAGVAEGPGVCRLATPADANALYPLQEGYEREEVLFRPEDFQPLVCRLHLGKLLRTQWIAGLWENGKPVAKAGTNALTPAWAQLGGVYTRPEHRQQGRQKRLLTFLLHRLAQGGRASCLFVKTSNDAALNLYRALGFQEGGAYRIMYGDRKEGARERWLP